MWFLHLLHIRQRWQMLFQFCVARYVACNVRGGFFKEFDEDMLPKVFEVHYEDEVVNLPSAPDVSNYLISEDAGFPMNGRVNAPFAEGLNGPEVAQKLKDEKSLWKSDTDPVNNVAEPKSEISQLPVASNPSVLGPVSLRAALPSEKPTLLGAPFRRDNYFSGQDMRYRGPEPPLIPKLPGQFQMPPFQGGPPMEEDNNIGNVVSSTPGLVQEPDTGRHDKQLARQQSQGHVTSASVHAGFQIKNEEANLRLEGQRQDQLFGNPGVVGSQNQPSGNCREHQTEGAKWNSLPSLSISVLQEIGKRCNSRVEFRRLISTSDDLRFSFEVMFTGENIGFGMGKTRKDAQQQAAENALQNLADKYLSHIARYKSADKEIDKHSAMNDNGFIWETINPGSDEQPVENGLLKRNASET